MKHALRSMLALSAAAATWLAANPARAQEEPAGFGEQQPLVISLEHVAGFSWQKFEVEGSDSVTNTETGTFTPFFGPYGTHARIGIHYFVAPPISIGALVNYSDNDELGSYLYLGARVGAAFPISSGTAIWIRGGAAYERTKLDFLGGNQTYTAFVPGGEIYFVLQPVDNFGFLLGGLFERTVGAKAKSKAPFGGSGSVERDFTRTEIALSFGVLAEF